MKTLLTIFFVLCCLLQANAQFQIDVLGKPVATETLDSAYLKCSYTLRFVKDTAKPDKITTEEMLLLVGKKVSNFFSYTNYQADSLRATVSPEQIMGNIRSYKGGQFAYQLFKNYPTGKITTTDRLVTSIYRYEEPLESPDWTILPDTSQILGYACQKATASFHGRSYVAWFTMEIPISNGPWKFTGLPGLILKIADTQNNYVFECSGIETPKEKVVIGMKKENYSNVSKKEFNKVYDRYRKDPMAFMSAAAPDVKITIKSPDGSPINAQSMRERPYNPIELE